MPGVQIQRATILVFRTSITFRIHCTSGLLLLSSWWSCQRVRSFYWFYLRRKVIDVVRIRNIRLPGDLSSSSDGKFQRALDTAASVPWFLIGLAHIAIQWVTSRVDVSNLRSRRGYRNVPIDEDAQILRFEDEE